MDKKVFEEINLSESEFVCTLRPFRESAERKRCLHKINNGNPFFDYVRYRILGLCAEEIYNNQVHGYCAEVGVFRGMFAMKINEVFPDRLLYLYDTFSGFSAEDMKYETDSYGISNKSWYKVINDFSKNVDLVDFITQNLPYKENVFFRKGFFPETAVDDQDKKFCFVSIDVDIYKPTLSALEFFWPRLATGGYIFIHDGKFEGVQRAIHEFEQENGILPKMPICDAAESYVICKA